MILICLNLLLQKPLSNYCLHLRCIIFPHLRIERCRWLMILLMNLEIRRHLKLRFLFLSLGQSPKQSCHLRWRQKEFSHFLSKPFRSDDPLLESLLRIFLIACQKVIFGVHPKQKYRAPLLIYRANKYIPQQARRMIPGLFVGAYRLNRVYCCPS